MSVPSRTVLQTIFVPDTVCAHGTLWGGCKVLPHGRENIPQMVAGGVKETFNKLADRSERELHLFRPPPQSSVITTVVWNRLFVNFRCGARACYTLLTLKMDYIQRVPTSFAALAVDDEDLAREYGHKAWDAFRLDPRQEAHDAKTWRLMQPGIFSQELDRF